MNLYFVLHHSSRDNSFSCLEPVDKYSPRYLPANYSNFMNWSSPNKVIIQGINQPQAAFLAVQMKAYGSDIVAGVSPGRGGTKVGNIPVFDLVEQVYSVSDYINTTLIFVHPYQVLDAVVEAIAAGIGRVIVVTSDVPPQDTIKLIQHAKASNTLLIGPGSHGMIIPQQTWLGKLQPQFYQPGKVGLITTSEYLSYEVAAQLNRANIGQSMVISLGNDLVTGSSLLEWLSILNEDPNTEAIISIAQRINETEDLVTYCKDYGFDKPIIVYLVGLKAPQEIIFRDALTIISNHLSASIPAVNRGQQAIERLKKAGIKIVKRPKEIPSLITDLLEIAAN